MSPTPNTPVTTKPAPDMAAEAADHQAVEREPFEKWALAHNYSIELAGLGLYESNVTNHCFRGWLALAASRAPVAVGVEPALKNRATELHDKAGMPWTQALELAMSEQGISLPLYQAINKLVCQIGCDGSIDSRHALVTEVMDALHDLDGGINIAAGAGGSVGAEPAETNRVYVCVRECDECHHCGMNDDHDTNSVCNVCQWSGPSPEKDLCPQCDSEGTMSAACPKCSGLYRCIAEDHITVAHPLQAQDAAPVEPKGVLTDDEICQLQQISQDVDMFALGRCPYDNNVNPNQKWRRATIRDVEQRMKFHAPRLTALVIKLFNADPPPAGVQGDAVRLDWLVDNDFCVREFNGRYWVAFIRDHEPVTPEFPDLREAIDAAIASQAGGKGA